MSGNDPNLSISVVIAAYNCASFVERAITSALSQEEIDLEVIIVNDASSDNIEEIVARFSHETGRVRLFSSDINLGPSGARNIGFKNARKEWIAVLDADDALAPGALEALIIAAEASDADIISGNFCFFEAASKYISEPAYATAPPIQKLDLLSFIEGARPGLDEPDMGLLKPIFRRSFLEKNCISYQEKIRHAEDFHLIVEAEIAGAKYILARSLVAYYYTTRESGLSKTTANYEKVINNTEYLISYLDRPDMSLERAALKTRADALRVLELERFGAMASDARPRFKMLYRAMSSSIGRGWLLSRLRNRAT